VIPAGRPHALAACARRGRARTARVVYQAGTRSASRRSRSLARLAQIRAQPAHLNQTPLSKAISREGRAAATQPGRDARRAERSGARPGGRAC
jgi:hypothetical protein